MTTADDFSARKQAPHEQVRKAVAAEKGGGREREREGEGDSKGRRGRKREKRRDGG